jgi:hypothetical protein
VIAKQFGVSPMTVQSVGEREQWTLCEWKSRLSNCVGFRTVREAFLFGKPADLDGHAATLDEAKAQFDAAWRGSCGHSGGAGVRCAEKPSPKRRSRHQQNRASYTSAANFEQEGRIMRRAVFYLRVSTIDQTTANQERELRDIAARMGCEVVKVYKDHGISGAKGRDKRPSFDASAAMPTGGSSMSSWPGRLIVSAAAFRTWLAS